MVASLKESRNILLGHQITVYTDHKNLTYNFFNTCFDAIKRVIGRKLLLAYPEFNAPFEIHTDASKLQIGAVISQKGKPITFYSRKMKSPNKIMPQLRKKSFP